jgi:hypothetical protein
VTGIVNGALSNYQIEPRKASDIVDLSVVTPVVSFQERDFIVYPNPFTDHLNIKNSDKLTRLTITDLTGRMELDVMYPPSIIKAAHLSRGIYIIRLYKDSGIISAEKFIKK